MLPLKIENLWPLMLSESLLCLLLYGWINEHIHKKNYCNKLHIFLRLENTIGLSKTSRKITWIHWPKIQKIKYVSKLIWIFCPCICLNSSGWVDWLRNLSLQFTSWDYPLCLLWTWFFKKNGLNAVTKSGAVITPVDSSKDDEFGERTCKEVLMVQGAKVVVFNMESLISLKRQLCCLL